MDDEAVIQRIVKETVKEMLSGMGFDVTSLQELQADLYYLRHMRKGSEFMSRHLKAAAIAALIPSVLYGVWQAVRAGLR